MAEGGTIRPVDQGSPATTDGAPNYRWRPSAVRSAAIYIAIPLFASVFALATVGLSFGGLAGYLPTAGVDVFYSFLRMGAAYTLSLGFALAYGYYAATHRTGERVMIPILDILQSIPILGFFPIALVVFAALTPGSWPGVNFASVFLIFTSMAWNMVFGVYESLKTLPAELKEAADTFRLRGMLLFRRVLFPRRSTGSSTTRSSRGRPAGSSSSRRRSSRPTRTRSFRGSGVTSPSPRAATTPTSSLRGSSCS